MSKERLVNDAIYLISAHFVWKNKISLVKQFRDGTKFLYDLLIHSSFSGSVFESFVSLMT